MVQNTLRNINAADSHTLSSDLDRLREFPKFSISNIEEFRLQVLNFATKFKEACIIGSGKNEMKSMVALGNVNELILKSSDGAFEQFDRFIGQNENKWKFGYLSYDLKNDVEDLRSENPIIGEFPQAHFFVPQIILLIEENDVFIQSYGRKADEIFDSICKESLKEIETISYKEEDFKQVPNKNEYIEIIKELKEEISNGNIYEINFCRNLKSRLNLDILQTYKSLEDNSTAPFSTFYKLNSDYLLCASPERFLKKSGNNVISQPMKGTRKRGLNKELDDALKEELKNSVKERAENVMIVDLVRNDLSKIAKKGTVTVEELFGVYSFRHVHQMISTIQAEPRPDVSIAEIIKGCFPMGSMTGAPKLRAMKLIEKHEGFKRGIFSGTVGMISPTGNFDLNVVIRSIVYNDETKEVNIPTGGAITNLCDAEEEWSECELKSRALLSSLKISKNA